MSLSTTESHGNSQSHIENSLADPAELISSSDNEMLAHIRSNGPQLLQKLQSGLNQLPFELVWAAHGQWPLLPGPRADRLRILVLDSSFNPPTLAHLALANSQRPRYSLDAREGDYDAKLLLLSVKNADKTLKARDASYLQRLEMMGLLAQDVSTQRRLEDGHSNVAIGIIDEPTFVGKSRILKEYFNSRLSSLSEQGTSLTQLSFIVGMDTLERLFSPKYYPPPPDRLADLSAEQVMLAALSRMLSGPPDGDNSFIVCAKRATLPSDITQHAKQESGEDQTLRLASRMGWLNLKSGGDSADSAGSLGQEDASSGEAVVDERIALIDIGDRESRFSSTAVRDSRGRIGVLGEAGSGPWQEWVTKRVATYVKNGGLYIA